MISTERVVESETTTLDDLDWEYIPTCDIPAIAKRADRWAGPYCEDDEAKWRAIRGCCGACTLLCDKCKDYYSATVAQGMTFSCALCDGAHTGYVYLEALG